MAAAQFLNSIHPAETLWSEHAPPAGYPKGVLAVPEPIVGTAFFPGGFGLWNPGACRPLPPFPTSGVMVLGHDFHSEAGYQASLTRGFESPNQPTWRNLIALLNQVNISPIDCFFTNVYMGLRAGVATTGPFPGRRDTVFVDHCRQFLLRQVEVQRPSLILTLGVYAPRMLAPLSKSLQAWTEGSGFRHIDEMGPVRTEVTFTGLPDFTPTVVALTHPCLRDASVRHRRFKDASGSDAEFLMLREVRSSGFEGQP